MLLPLTQDDVVEIIPVNPQSLTEGEAEIIIILSAVLPLTGAAVPSMSLQADLEKTKRNVMFGSMAVLV